MDRAIWATWYDLPEAGRGDYLAWLHEQHLPAMLERPGYLWAAHVKNIVHPERERPGRLVRTSDPAVPTGFTYLVLFGAESPHVFVDPTPAELAASLPAADRERLSQRQQARACIFVEVARVDGPAVAQRGPGLTPGPIVQFGTFNVNRPEHEDEVEAWYARDRLPLMRTKPTCVGARRVVSVAGWAKHGILYEFAAWDELIPHFSDPGQWSQRVVPNLIHTPHSPTLGERIWPPAQLAQAAPAPGQVAAR